MALYGSPRRWYLRKRQNARELCDGFEGFWRSQQEAQPGTALPDNFPLLSVLTAGGYTTVEDLRGADADELVFTANMHRRDAQIVIDEFLHQFP